MKARYGFTGQSKKAMIQEINRQILEQKNTFTQNIEIMILWTLHNELGFGKRRLKKFYKTFTRNYNAMCKAYEMDDAYPAECKLREIGVDLDEWKKENEV